MVDAGNRVFMAIGPMVEGRRPQVNNISAPDEHRAALIAMSLLPFQQIVKAVRGEGGSPRSFIRIMLATDHESGCSCDPCIGREGRYLKLCEWLDDRWALSHPAAETAQA